MEKWTPITKSELFEEIRIGENEFNEPLKRLWEVIKIQPEKWEAPENGKEGGGFWVVGICGNKVIWYNDIEDGFNISTYQKYGQIDEYYCNQDNLKQAVFRILE